MRDIERYYDENAQQEWERLEKRHTEFSLVQRALREHLPPPPARVVDIGAGPGRYAVHLSQQGYRMTLVDISKVSLDLARTHTHSRIENFIHADARQLDMLPDDGFDSVLLFGPLYHLLSLHERRAAVVEAVRVLKPKGVLLAMFMNRYAAIRYFAVHNPERVVKQREFFSQFLRTGEYCSPENNPDSFNALPTEIRPLMESVGLATLDLIGCEGILDLIEGAVNGLSANDREAWMDLNYQLSKDPSTHGAVTHLLYVGKKT